MPVKSPPESCYELQGEGHSVLMDPLQRKPDAGLMRFATEVRKDQAGQQNEEGEKNVQIVAYTLSHKGT